MVAINPPRQIHALKVKQWASEWDDIHWDPTEHRSEPPHWFYQFKLSARSLRRLSGVYARTTDRTASADDLGIQRQLNSQRSREIGEFVRYGYPWSSLSQTKRRTREFNDLRQPGWLPTSIVVNILVSGDNRGQKQIVGSDLIEIQDGENDIATLSLPQGFSDKSWQPEALHPIEVIDGQHRLWAFDDADLHGEYELPVVAFIGLDRSWQAYLFYTINIKPKKINASLAFDLYPLLRTEKWLEKFEGHAIYREIRSQELVDKLWSYPESPWYHRINMLGETGTKGLMVNQSSWVRSLIHSFVKSWEGRRIRIGGIFGSKVGDDKMVLAWGLSEQAAFLIFMGQEIQQAIKDTEGEWAQSLRGKGSENQPDPAFFGPNNLLNQDQGIRTLLQIVNDFFFQNADDLNLISFWEADNQEEENEDEHDPRIASAINSLRANSEVSEFMTRLAAVLATYDWRASNASGLNDDVRTLKASFRGSGGYKELRKHVLSHITNCDDSLLKETAKSVQQALNYV